MNLSLYSEFPSAEVDVIPLKGTYLAPPQTGGEFQKEHFITAVLFSLNQQTLDFFRGQHLHIPGFNRWETAAIRRVMEEEFFGNCFVQCGMESGVNASNSLVGQV